MPDDTALSGPFGDLLEDIDEADLLAAYRRAVLDVVDPDGPRRLRIVYSPLHGVGGAVLPGFAGGGGVRAAAAGGRPGHARPGLPHRAVPEPGGARRARPGAGRRRAHPGGLVLVNDPDADRLAVAVPERVPGRGSGSCRATSSGC